MKKLLITTMAAVSVGLCAKADFTANGTSFEGSTEGDAFNPTDTYWTIPTNTDDVFMITNVTYSTGATKQHWEWTDGEKALFIDTVNPILRNVNAVPAEAIDNPAQDVKTPVFFDSVVQFTATDVKPIEDDQYGNGTDKLMVWLYQSPEDVTEENQGTFNEIERTTKVAITAGYLDSNETLKVVNYLTNIEDVEVAPDSWHRLTIKSFEDGGLLKFNVWIDGVPVKTVNGESSFLSMLNRDNSSTPTQLQGVAFDGKGVVDDIVFTTTAPEFTKEDDSEASNVFNVVISTPTNAEIIGVMDPNDEDTPIIRGGDGKYSVPVGTKSIIVAVNYAGTITNDGAEPIEEGTWAIPVDVSSAVAGDTIQVEITVANAIVTYPTVKPNGDSTTQETLSAGAVAAIEAALAGVETMPDVLTVIVNEKEYFGDEAVAKINEVVAMFEAAEEGKTLKFFNEKGEMIVSFKATNPFMETETAEATDYEAMVGGLAATVTSSYTVNKETVDLTPGVTGVNEAVTFKLVIKPGGSTGSDTGSAVQE